MKTITIREAAEQLGCTVSNVRKMIRNGQLNGSRAASSDSSAVTYTINAADIKAIQKRRAAEASYLTTDVFADQAGITRAQALALVKNGTIEPARQGGRGRTYLFYPRDVKRARKMVTVA